MITTKRYRRLLSCASATAAVAALTACTSAPIQGSPATTPTHVTGLSPTRAPAKSRAATDAQQLRAAAVRSSDLAHHLLVRPAPGGDTVHDEVTLDNCGFYFSSENNRVARHQIEIIDPADPRVRFGNELVAYRTTAQAQQALEQWHRSVTTCPRGYARSAVAAEPPMKYNILRDTIDTTSLPVHHNEITTESARPRTGARLWLTAIFQTHGRYLDAIYLDAKRAPTTTDEKAARVFAEATGRRLNKLPE